MSRRNAAEKRPVLPEPQFNSRLASMIVARLMKHGKKSTAQRILSDAFGMINERTGVDPLEVFETAVRNATPLVEVRARRVGGATYQVPVEVRPRRATTLAIRWVVDYARNRREKTMAECLAGELLDGELIERLVAVERLHDPVAVGPDGADVVEMEAVGVGVAHGVEPVAAEVLAVAGRGKQTVDDFFVDVRRVVLHERVDLFRRRLANGIAACARSCHGAS